MKTVTPPSSPFPAGQGMAGVDLLVGSSGASVGPRASISRRRRRHFRLEFNDFEFHPEACPAGMVLFGRA
eukprot:7562279-Alexandrium_andersonii.AAC.2